MSIISSVLQTGTPDKAIEEASKMIEKGQYNELTTKIVDWAISNGSKLIIGLLVIYIGFKVTKSITKKLESILIKRSVDVTIIKFLKSLLRGILNIALVAVVAVNWGVKFSGIATIIASAGVAVGLALQGSLANFAGGFIILLLRPFKVGDYILTAGYEGTVEQIGVFYTNLTTSDNKLVLIPNGNISNGSLINYSAKETRRVDLKFGVGYECDILHVRSVLKEIVKNNKLIMTHPEPFVNIIEHGSSSINFGIRVWCKNSDYWTVYYDLLEQVKIRFDEEEISIPHSQMYLNLKNNIEDATI